MELGTYSEFFLAFCLRLCLRLLPGWAGCQVLRVCLFDNLLAL